MPKATLIGKEQMVAKMSKIAKKLPNEVARALYIRANEVMTRSKREFVPVAEERGGTLRASGHVHEPEIKGGRIKVALSYGGPADAYAIAVHEHLSVHSPPSWQDPKAGFVQFHPEGHGPKYLERPLMEAVETMAEDVARDIDLAKTVT